MTRRKALLQLARSTNKFSTGELSNFVPSRLLSNSQASTSASSDNTGANRLSGQRGARQSQSSDSRTEQSGQRDRRSDTRSSSRFPRDAPRSDSGLFSASPPTSGGRATGAELSQGSQKTAEPETGFVEDGQYPYAASEVEVLNVAGSTETAWEFLGCVDEQALTWFGMDFTRGTLPEVERNALLSNDAKELMYQMHKHDDKRYSVSAIARTFQIRQQRVMAILTLKGMEHGNIPVNPGYKKPKSSPSSTSSAEPTDTPTDTTSAESPDQPDSQSPDDSSAQNASPDSAGSLGVRAQAVKEAMDEAAKEVPEYLKRISRQSQKWHITPQEGTSKEQVTDSNILMAWVKSMVKDPFWVRPSKDDEELEPIPDFGTLEASQDVRTMAKADQEIEQQLLQDYHQEKQHNTERPDDSAESNDPKEEGLEQYLLSDPDNLPYIMEHELWDCHEPHGTGERHVKFIPRYPRYEFVEDDRPEALEADKEAAGGKAKIERPVVSFWEEANLIQAEEEEIHLVREFKERLSYNLQQTGADIRRESRIKDGPSRPKAGWSMVVQDVSKEGYTKQYVALPGGRSRKLTADEKVYLERMQPKRRKKIA